LTRQHQLLALKKETFQLEQLTTLQCYLHKDLPQLSH
jgi:hypothetical protein